MPTYVVLINFTDQGIRNVKQTTERTDHGGEIAEKHGLKLEQAYWTGGALRHGRRLRGTGRRSHERPPPGDQQLYGHHTNHHAPSLRRARDVGHPPEDRLSRPTSEQPISTHFGE